MKQSIVLRRNHNLRGRDVEVVRNLTYLLGHIGIKSCVHVSVHMAPRLTLYGMSNLDIVNSLDRTYTYVRYASVT